MKRLKLTVLISGGGTTLQNLIDKKALGELEVDIQLVVSSNSEAAGIGRAEKANIPVEVIRRRSFASADAYSESVFARCREVESDYVLMGGFLTHILIPEDFENRVLNTHPSLIPSFCGKGFYGLKVHQAVLDYGAKVSGCTIHFVDNEYDHGPIILQRCVEVAPSDSAETLAKRVFEAECEAYPAVLRLLAAGRVRIDGRRVHSAP